MAKLGHPTLFCHDLVIDESGRIADYTLRLKDHKRKAVEAFKALKFDRYKIVTTVTLGQIADQGVRVASRCLMDQETDNFASGSYKNSSLFGVATVYAFYYE